MTALTAQATALPISKAPIWPLFLAPLVAGVYYLAMKDGFASSLSSVVADASDVASRGLGGPTWGTHWIYRTFAELVSVLFAVFVTAGIAQQRAKLAGIIGGATIAFVYFVRNLMIVFGWIYLQPEDFQVIEPWYQHVIEVLVIICAPFTGLWISEVVKEIVDRDPRGFGGVNRWHFLWLWVAGTAYASGVIAPFLKWWVGNLTSSGYGGIIPMFVYGIPVLIYWAPVYWSLNTLAHRSGWSRTADNLLGPVIIVVGWLIATAIVYAWGWLLRAVFG